MLSKLNCKFLPISNVGTKGLLVIIVSKGTKILMTKNRNEWQIKLTIFLIYNLIDISN